MSARLYAYPECKDFLAALDKKPFGVEYTECKINKDGQQYLEARYRLSGKIAHSVAAYLKRQYKMGDLRFACCGWQARPDGTFRRKVNGVDFIYSMVMVSQEGVERDWNKIPWFFIYVRLYPGTI